MSNQELVEREKVDARYQDYTEIDVEIVCGLMQADIVQGNINDATSSAKADRTIIVQTIKSLYKTLFEAIKAQDWEKAQTIMADIDAQVQAKEEASQTVKDAFATVKDTMADRRYLKTLIDRKFNEKKDIGVGLGYVYEPKFPKVG